MRGRTSCRKKRQKKSLIPMTILFWAVSAATVLALVGQSTLLTAAGEETAQETIAMQYVDHIFSIVNRGSERSQKPESTEDNGQSQRSEAFNSTLMGMVDLSYPVVMASESSHLPAGEEPEWLEELAADNITEDADGKKGTAGKDAAIDESYVAEAEPVPVVAEEPVAVVDTTANQDPLVLIYHTHATESYQPVGSGNFHSVEEYGTVRQVGEVMAAELEAKGISVIHDKTLHDNPSYNASYSRSLETVNYYLAEYPSLAIVVDLHRDAASYSGNQGKTVNINGDEVATYSVVVGKGNANYNQLTAFASKINELADALYPGLSNRIIEKDYRFNQYVADQYILLEVGNNENTIEQAKLTGKYFADVLEAYITETNQ